MKRENYDIVSDEDQIKNNDINEEAMKEKLKSLFIFESVARHDKQGIYRNFS